MYAGAGPVMVTATMDQIPDLGTVKIGKPNEKRMDMGGLAVVIRAARPARGHDRTGAGEPPRGHPREEDNDDDNEPCGSH